MEHNRVLTDQLGLSREKITQFRERGESLDLEIRLDDDGTEEFFNHYRSNAAFNLTMYVADFLWSLYKHVAHQEFHRVQLDEESFVAGTYFTMNGDGDEEHHRFDVSELLEDVGDEERMDLLLWIQRCFFDYKLFEEVVNLKLNAIHSGGDMSGRFEAELYDARYVDDDIYTWLFLRVDFGGSYINSASSHEVMKHAEQELYKLRGVVSKLNIDEHVWFASTTYGLVIRSKDGDYFELSVYDYPYLYLYMRPNFTLHESAAEAVMGHLFYRGEYYQNSSLGDITDIPLDWAREIFDAPLEPVDEQHERDLDRLYEFG